MNAAEFNRRMDGHMARAEASLEQHRRTIAAFAPALATYTDVRAAGCRITRWHVTPAQADEMDAFLGQHSTILGYPVVVSA